MRKLFQTPEEAEMAFYEAIERADIQALDAIWSADENVVCVHPGASRIQGRQAVMDSFVELFSEAPVLHFTIVDSLHTGNENLAIHLVREKIQLDGQLISVMISTNVFQIESGGWRLLMHHASPEPDDSLTEDYDEILSFASLGLDDFDDELDELEEQERPVVLH